MRFFIDKLRYFATLLIVIFAVACSEDEGVATTARLSADTVSGRATSCAVVLTAQQGTTYEACIISDDEWCHFTKQSLAVEGTIDERCNKSLFIYFDENYDVEPGRQATIRVDFSNGQSFTLTLVQRWADQTIAFDRQWPELPVCYNDKTFHYRSYYDNVNGKSNVRNYTICFDETKKAALWVAYPMHTMYVTGPADRDNSKFVVEPTIPVQDQARNSYYGYQRGHQIAAADRKCSQKMMDQTFYYTNMTPQFGNFNGKLWASLEGAVRAERCADTLYVVTGAYFDGERHSSIDVTTKDRSGTVCPVPTHYYKLLLRTNSGNTKKAISEIKDASELRAVAVFIQHHDSGNNNSLQSDWFMSVNELEQITGFDFFPMLDDAIEEQVEEQCDRSKWF